MKSKDKSITRRIVSELSRIKFGLAVMILLSVLLMVCDLLSPAVLGKITGTLNDYFLGNFRTDDLIGEIGPKLIILAVIYGVYAVLSYLQVPLLNNTVSRHFTYGLRVDISNKLSRVPVSFADKTRPGEVLNRMNNDVSNMSTPVYSIVNVFLLGAVQIVAILTMLFIIKWQLALVVTAVVPLSLFTGAKLSARAEKYFDKTFETDGKISSHAEETYGGYSTIKAFNLEKQQLQKFKELNRKQAEFSEKAFFSNNVVTPVVTVINQIVYALICLYGGYFAVKGELGVDGIVMFILYTQQLSNPLVSISGGLASSQKVKAAAKRVYDILDAEEMQPQTDKMPETADGDVEFRGVDFSYSEDKPLIQNLNFTAKKGQKVAIVGPTGAGKTTIVNLLMRFYDVQKGEILIGGKDIEKADRNSVRSLFSMVLQDAWLFGGTIFENVAYGRDNVTKEEVERACENAYCDHFIKTLPEGYDTVIDEGCSNVSGGQRQLLTIARAFLTDRDFLILDEATSNVDTRTEIFIQKAMDNLMKGKTCFVIAHRLSTIIDADVILVIDGGKIVEIGKHEELLEKQGFYYRLYKSQYDN